MSVHIEVELDFAILGSMSFTLTETGGGDATGSISVSSADGPRFLRSDLSAYYLEIDPSAGSGHYADLLTSLKGKLDAVGNATYTVAFNTTTQRVTISATGGSVTAFSLTSFNTVAQQVLGYTANKTGALTHAADRAPYYWISTTQGGLTGYEWDQEEDADIAIDHIAHDGNAYGMSKPGAPILFQATIPMEPKEMVQEHFAESTTPYTWQRFFRDARNTRAYALRFNDDNVNHTFILRNRSDGALFKPRLSRKDWWDFSDIKLDARVLNSAIDASAAPPAFVPTDLGSALSLWLKADGITGSSPVTAWNDSSGNSRHFSTAVGSPASSTLGGFTCVDLDGSTQYFTSSTTLANIISSAYHVYVVCQPDANFSDTSGSLNSVLADASGYWSVGGWIPSSVNKLSHYNWDGSAKNAGVAYTSGSIACLEAARSGSNIHARVHLSASSSSVATTASGATSVTSGSLKLGVNWSGALFFNGKVAEIICVNRALTTDEQIDMRSYILDRFSLNNPATALY